MKIRVTSHEGLATFPFDSAGPWSKFKEVFERSGHKICTLGFEEKCDAIIVNKINTTVMRYIKYSRIPREKRVLILWEPHVVDKEGFLSENLQHFGHIYAPSKSWAKQVKGEFFHWPQDNFMPWRESIIEWQSRSNKAVIIQGNKFSAVKGEEYSLRRKIIMKTRDSELDLFGTGWNRGFGPDWFHWSSSFLTNRIKDISLRSLYNIGRKYSKYGGAVENKHETLQNYKISIVIENSLDYVSEKLFDAVRAGCVTIYVGPNLTDYKLNINGVFQVMPNGDSVLKKLRELNNLPVEILFSYAKQSYDFFKKDIDLWENNIVLKNLAKSILLRIAP